MERGPADDRTRPNKGGLAVPDRELIDTGTDKRYVTRDDQGKFKESADVGRSHAADQRHNAANTTKPGQGDRGDRPSEGDARKKR
jgi:hypothetical protein